MEEKYLITLYEKIPVNEDNDNVMLFRKIRSIKNASININDDFQEATFYDEKDQKVKVDTMYSPYTIVSDDRYCYGFPLTMNQLKMNYPNVKDENELYKLYDSQISKTIGFSYYNKQTDSVKVLTTNEKQFEKAVEDDLFSQFNVEYDSSDDNLINIKKEDIPKIIKMLEKKQYKKLHDKLVTFNENLDNSLKVAKSIFEAIIELEQQARSQQEEVKNEESLDDILESLNSLVGLNKIKQEVNKLIKYLLYIDKTKKYLKLEQPNLHMFFTGNPGTGKTTVARIIGKILYKLGYIKVDKFAEITPKDLIAEYVGQTAVKTAELIEKNKGGVIFIDEAYVLASEHQGFGEEALVEILKELEKNETMFIFAGYNDEMKKFMEINPGLTSRIGYYLKFEDYNTSELYQIFERKASKIGFVIDEKLKEKIKKVLEETKNEKNFGNGRYIDKLINKIILQHSINTEKYKRKRELITLKENDFTNETEEELTYKTKTKKIGY